MSRHSRNESVHEPELQSAPPWRRDLRAPHARTRRGGAQGPRGTTEPRGAVTPAGAARGSSISGRASRTGTRSTRASSRSSRIARFPISSTTATRAPCARGLRSNSACPAAVSTVRITCSNLQLHLRLSVWRVRVRSSAQRLAQGDPNPLGKNAHRSAFESLPALGSRYCSSRQS